MNPHHPERIALYIELLEECDGPQQLLQGRRLLDLSDVKEWIRLKLCEEFLSYEPFPSSSRKG